MPQGRHRKPFSNKQKKEQLQAKRERKRNKNETTSDTSDQEHFEARTRKDSLNDGLNKIVRKIHEQPKMSQEESEKRNRFNLYFLRDSKEELDALKKDASRKFNTQSEYSLEFDINDIYQPDSPLDMPRRPKWSYEMSKNALEDRERTQFKEYLDKIFSNFDKKSLSYFEMNLETWRQLWRVLEISDIILFIVDARFPVLHFSPIFYNYVTNELKKDCILIMNKIDLIPPELVIAWKYYFKTRFPNLHIITFTSVPKSRRNTKTVDAEAKRKREIYAIQSHCRLYELVKNISRKHVNLDTWNELIDKNMRKIETNREIFQDDETIESHPVNDEEEESTDTKNNFITLGCCGFPNVGKSSLLNTLVTRKVVSVSKTPGHTKHLQTIFLTPNVRLCDCPGLVFPSLVCKPLQILSGIYPIAQLQEPYSCIRYMGERIPLNEILSIKHPDDRTTGEWTPLDICEAWALKRRYFTAKAARPDVYRAANEILRMALDGRLFFYLRPKYFLDERDKWLQHPETQDLQNALKTYGFENILQRKAQVNESDVDEDEVEDEDEDSEDGNKDSEDRNVDASNEDDEDKEEVNRYALLSNIGND